jgi:hypothetical protein
MLFQWANTIKNSTWHVCLVQRGYHYHLIKCNLFSPSYSWKIAHFALNNNHSFTHSPYYLRLIMTHAIHYCRHNLTTDLYIKATQGNLKMCPLWAVAFYIQLKLYALYTYIFRFPWVAFIYRSVVRLWRQ